MIKKTFSGSHFETGRQIGSYYKAAHTFFAPITEASLLNQQLKFYEKNAPEILDEWRGIAQECNCNFDQIAHSFLVGEILFHRKRGRRSCSIGGFTDVSGQLHIARNYDWHPTAAKVFQTWEFDFPEKKVIAISDMGIVDATGLDKKNQIFLYEDAINSDGLFIGMTFAYRWMDAIGLTSFDAVRLAAWRCKTVEEVVKLFETHPLSSPKNFFVADSTGKMAVIQHGVDKFDVRYPNSEGLLALTNHFVGRLETEDQVRVSNTLHTTFDRYERIMSDMHKLSVSKEVTFENLDKMMTSPDSPICQCIYDPEAPKQIKMETVWTLLLNPMKQQYQLIENPRSSERKTTNFSM